MLRLVAASLGVLFATGVRGDVAVSLKPHHTYLVQVTDPHGWYLGQKRHDPDNVDYASVASFIQSVRSKAQKLEGCRVYFFENGDMVDGGGLTDEHGGNKMTFPLLEQVGFDARNIGNHEMYNHETMAAIPFPGTFVTSNIVHRDSGQPFGKRFMLLPYSDSGDQVLVFSFLYNMEDYDGKLATVQHVEDCILSEWFSEAMQLDNVAFIVVLAHMHFKDPLVFLLLDAFRAYKGDWIPIIFLTGHTHLRRSAQLDSHSYSLESGRYLDTIGIISFPNDFTYQAKMMFDAHFLDASRKKLLEIAGSTTETKEALRLRSKFRETAHQLGLYEHVGYSPRSYRLFVPYWSPDSILRLWVDNVVEQELFDSNYPLETCSRGLFFFGGGGAIRYDLPKGRLQAEDLWHIAPFVESYMSYPCVKGQAIKEAVSRLSDPQWKNLLKNEKHLRFRRPPHTADFPVPVPSVCHTNLDRIQDSSESYTVVFGVFDSPMIAQLLELPLDQAVPFREGQVTQHSIWINYFKRFD